MSKESPRIRPLGDRVLVKCEEALKKTEGGILLPDQAQERPLKGKVVAVGPGKRNDKGERMGIEVEEGEVVMFGKWAGHEDEDVLGKGMKILQEADILAVLE